MSEVIPLHFADGATNVINIYSTQKLSSTVVVIFPAMGVPASYYRHYAATLSKSNFHVATVDHRGHGNSSVRPSRKVNFGYSEQIEIEYRGIIETLKNNFPNSKLAIMGHSLGGQVGGMFAAQYPHLVDGLIVNASCSVYYKGWGNSAGLGVLGFAAFCKMLARQLGYYPGNRVGFGGREARGIIEDWFVTAKSGRFVAHGSSFNYDEAMSKFSKPLLGITYHGDTSAPPLALKYFLEKFPSQNAQQHHIKAAEKLNHYSWVKQPDLSMDLICNWLNNL